VRVRAVVTGIVVLVTVGLLPAQVAMAQPPQQAPKPLKPAKSSSNAPVPTAESVLEPKAISLLKAASARLAAARSDDVHRAPLRPNRLIQSLGSSRRRAVAGPTTYGDRPPWAAADRGPGGSGRAPDVVELD
jgi:hypothetical protein